MTNQFKQLSRVALKAYPKEKGRIRSIQWGIFDKTRGIETSVAHVYWDSGHVTDVPLDRLVLEPFYAETAYAWEKTKRDPKVHVDPEVDSGKHDA